MIKLRDIWEAEYDWRADMEAAITEAEETIARLTRERDEARATIRQAEARIKVMDEARAKVMDRAIAAANLCSYDMGTDPETGLIGCKLVLSGGECVCAGIITYIAGDKP